MTPPAEADAHAHEERQRTFEDAAARRLMRRVLAQWPMIVACAVVAMLAASVASSLRTKQYEATAKVQLEQVDMGVLG